MHPENVLESLYRNRLQGSEQLQTVFSTCNQELSRDCVAPSYQTLGSMVRQHVDQTIRTRNFKTWNGRIETGELVKRQKGRHVSAKEKWDNAFNGRRMDSVQEEILVFLTTGLILLNEHNHPLLLQERRHRLLAESFTNMEVREKKESPSGLKGKIPCTHFLGGTCTEPSRDFWHLLACLQHKSESGCKYGDKCKISTH